MRGGFCVAGSCEITGHRFCLGVARARVEKAYWQAAARVGGEVKLVQQTVIWSLHCWSAAVGTLISRIFNPVNLFLPRIWASSSVFGGSWPACAPLHILTHFFANPELECYSSPYIDASCRSPVFLHMINPARHARGSVLVYFYVFFSAVPLVSPGPPP